MLKWALVAVFLQLACMVENSTVSEGLICSSGNTIANWQIDSNSTGIRAIQVTCTDNSQASVNNFNPLTGTASMLCLGQIGSYSYALNSNNALVYLNIPCNNSGTQVSFGNAAGNSISGQSCPAGTYISQLQVNRMNGTGVAGYTDLIYSASGGNPFQVSCGTGKSVPTPAGTLGTASLNISSSQIVSLTSWPAISGESKVGSELLGWRLTAPVPSDFACIRLFNSATGKYSCLSNGTAIMTNLLNSGASAQLTLALNLRRLALTGDNALSVKGQLESPFTSATGPTNLAISVISNGMSSGSNAAVGYVSTKSGSGYYTGTCPSTYYVYQVSMKVNSTTGYIVAVSFTCVKYFSYSPTYSLTIQATSATVFSETGYSIITSPANAPFDALIINNNNGQDALPTGSSISFVSPWQTGSTSSINSAYVNSASSPLALSCPFDSPPYGFLPSSMTTVSNTDGYVEAIGFGCSQVLIQLRTVSVIYSAPVSSSTKNLNSFNGNSSWAISFTVPSSTGAFFWADMGQSGEYVITFSISIHSPVSVPLQNLASTSNIWWLIWGGGVTETLYIPSSVNWTGTNFPLIGTIVLDVKGNFGFMYTFYLRIRVWSVGTVTIVNINDSGSTSSSISSVNGTITGSFNSPSVMVNYPSQTITSNVALVMTPDNGPYIGNETVRWRCLSAPDPSVACLRYKLTGSNRYLCAQANSVITLPLYSFLNLSIALNLRMIATNYAATSGAQGYPFAIANTGGTASMTSALVMSTGWTGQFETATSTVVANVNLAVTFGLEIQYLFNSDFDPLGRNRQSGVSILFGITLNFLLWSKD